MQFKTDHIQNIPVRNWPYLLQQCRIQEKGWSPTLKPTKTTLSPWLCAIRKITH